VFDLDKTIQRFVDYAGIGRTTEAEMAIYYYTHYSDNVKAKLHDLWRKGYLILWLADEYGQRAGNDKSTLAAYLAFDMEVTQTLLKVPCAAVMTPQSFSSSSTYRAIKKPNTMIWDIAMDAVNGNINNIDYENSFMCGITDDKDLKEFARRLGIDLLSPNEVFANDAEPHIFRFLQTPSQHPTPLSKEDPIFQQQEESVEQPTQEVCFAMTNNGTTAANEVCFHHLLQEVAIGEIARLHKGIMNGHDKGTSVRIAPFSLSPEKPAMTKYKVIHEDGSIEIEELTKDETGKTMYKKTMISKEGIPQETYERWGENTSTLAIMTKEVDEFDMKVPMTLRTRLRRLDEIPNPKSLLQQGTGGRMGKGKEVTQSSNEIIDSGRGIQISGSNFDVHVSVRSEDKIK